MSDKDLIKIKQIKDLQDALDAAANSGISGIQPGTGIDIDNSNQNLPQPNLDSNTLAILALAQSALQSGDNISELINDIGYVVNGANVSIFVNDAGYITGYTVTENDVTQHQEALVITENQISDLNHFSGNYNDLTNKPDLSAFDNVDTYADFSSFPATGASDVFYVAEDTGIMYRWAGSAYVIVSGGLALGETSSTAYRGDRGKVAYDHSQLTSGNPHNVTKSELGLGNVDNTSDVNKPISNATQAALDNKLEAGDNVSELANDAGYITGIAELPEVGDVPAYPVDGSSGMLIHKASGNEWVNTPVPVGALQNFSAVDEMGLSGGGIRTLVGEDGFWLVALPSFASVDNAARSFDNGLTWEAITIPSRDWDGCKMKDGRIILAAQTNGTNLIVSDDFGTTWQGQSYVNLYATDIDANDNQVWVVTRWNVNGVYRSTNNGGSWSFISTGSSPRKVQYGYDQTWLVARSAGTGYRIERSTDDGATWAELTSVPQQGVTYTIGYYKRVWLIFDTGTKLLYKSVDNGDTWTQVASSITFTGSPSRITGGAGMWYMLFGSKWFISPDEGVSWTVLSGNVPSIGFGKAVFSAGVVMVATSSGVSRFPVLDSPEKYDKEIEIHDVAPGGTTGQVYTKNSANDYDAGWQNVPASGGQVDSVTGTTNEIVVSGTTVDPVLELAATVISSLALADTALQPGDEFSGDYNDLTNKPDLSAFDNVDTYANVASFPATGESDVFYIAEDTGFVYRWAGATYVLVTGAAPDLSEDLKLIDYTKYNSLFDVFVPTVLRNNERNNYELTGETRWTITAVDTGLKTITFDNELPFEINPEISRRKWGLFISVSNTCIIDAVDYSTKTITYSANNSTPTVGDKVFFYNPYASFAAENNNNPIPVNNNLATDLYNFLGAVWRHSDGTWRGWVKGWLPGNSGCSFIASSPDMVNWTGINGTLQEKGQGKFTHSYITDANGISIVGGAVPIPNSDGTKYASTFYTAGNGKRDTGIVIYDEDGIILNVSTGFLLDNFLCSIVHHHNNYYLYSCEVPDSNVSNRVIKETIVKDLNTLDVISSQTLEFTRGVNNETGNPLSSHAGQPGAFIYNDEVYVIFGGTGELGISNNLFSGNRMFQLMRRKEDGTFEFPKDNPYIINPLHSELFWDQTTWNNDHPGAYPLIVIDRNKLYFHFTMTSGTNNYQMALYSKILN